MAAYVVLDNWTDQGIRNIRESPKREDAVRTLCEKVGGRVKDVYRTMSRYDFVAIVDAPDEIAVSAFLFSSAPAATPALRRCAPHAAGSRTGHFEDGADT